ncbi:MAG TPA: DUF3999 family protein [Candidatus Sulfotelmatobacter sp.]|nr:DUF3999 family protein [Candidatus Sulfotelmatobacter sp.]
MKTIAAAFLLATFLQVPARPEQAIAYFTNVRGVQVSEPSRQNFFIVDEELWNHSRPDLGDLRLYDGDSPVQYFLSEQRTGVSSEEIEAKILNLGSVSGHTEFDLDAQGIAEYDRIRLRLDAHDFVATVSVSGGNAPGKAAEVALSPSTLYDFTKEQLGANSQLKLPTSSFRYLHIKLSPGIRPDQVKGATIYNLREHQASWTKVGSCSAPQQQGRITLISCDVPPRVPLNRLSFQVDPHQVNFRRSVSVEDGKGVQVSSGEISRVRVNRASTLVTDEEMAVNPLSNPGQLTIRVDHGDNPPLAITSVQPMTLERRIYFNPQGKSGLKLYYGDDKLSAPVYDYAQFFHLEDSPAQAKFDAGAHNPQYTGRPDERPWSERHSAILWTAMLIAVLALAVVALRGLRGQSAS